MGKQSGLLVTEVKECLPNMLRAFFFFFISHLAVICIEVACHDAGWRLADL